MNIRVLIYGLLCGLILCAVLPCRRTFAADEIADADRVKTVSQYNFVNHPLGGQVFQVRLDKPGEWPSLERDLPVFFGRHFGNDAAGFPHVSRRVAPINFGAFKPYKARRPEVMDCGRSWAGNTLSLAYARGKYETMKMDADDYEPEFKVYASRLSPAVLLEAADDMVLFSGKQSVGTSFGDGGPGRERYAGAGEMKTFNGVIPFYYAAMTAEGLVSGDLADLAQRELLGMKWALFWYGDNSFFSSATPCDSGMDHATLWSMDKAWLPKAVKVDCPMLVVCDSEPEAIVPDEEAGGLRIRFLAFEPHRVVVVPLFGEALPPAAETEKWRAGMPGDILEKCEWWADNMAGFPVSASESYALDAERGAITIGAEFEYLDVREGSAYHAPVPQFMALALKYGFPLKFSTPVHDPGLPTCIGPFMAAPGVKSYSVEFEGMAGLLRPPPAKEIDAAAAPERLNAMLRGEVEKILEAGPLAPWHKLQKNHFGMSWGFFVSLPFLVHANPGETLYFLAEALPLLPPDLRQKTLDYMKRERESYPPESYGFKQGGIGARREAYELSDGFLESFEKAQGEINWPWGGNNINKGRGKNFFIRLNLMPAQNAYYLARYYEALGEKCPGECWAAARAGFAPYLENFDWASGTFYRWPGAYREKTPEWANGELIFEGMGGVMDANMLFAGALGMARLAAMTGAAGHERFYAGVFARAAAARFAFSRLTEYLHAANLVKLGQNQASPADDLRMPFAVDEYGVTLMTRYTLNHQAALMPMYGAVPELYAFAREFMADKLRAYYGTYITNVPSWFIAWNDIGINGESNCEWPQDSHQAFLAHARVFDAQPEWLEKRLDVPWQARGDLYYLHKLAETIKAYSRAE